MQSERRKNHRYPIQGKAFAVIGSESTKMLPIIDIGIGGLGVCADDAWKIKPAHLEILVEDCSFYLDRIPFKNILRFPAACSNPFHSSPNPEQSLRIGIWEADAFANFQVTLFYPKLCARGRHLINYGEILSSGAAFVVKKTHGTRLRKHMAQLSTSLALMGCPKSLLLIKTRWASRNAPRPADKKARCRVIPKNSLHSRLANTI